MTKAKVCLLFRRVLLLALTQQYQHRSVRLLALFQHGVALFPGCARYVARRLLATQADQQCLALGKAIEGNPGLHECHRTYVPRDVDVPVSGQNRVHDTCTPRLNKNNHCETAMETLI